MTQIGTTNAGQFVATTTLTWAPQNRLIGFRRVGTDALTETFTYNDAGRLATRAVTGGNAYTYRWDGDRLQSIAATNLTTTSIVARFAYAENRRPLSMTLPNGTTFFYHFNPGGGVDTLTAASGVRAVTYTYDTWGNLIEAVHGPAWAAGLTENPFGAFGERALEDGLSQLILGDQPYSARLGSVVSAEMEPKAPRPMLGGRTSAAAAQDDPRVCSCDDPPVWNQPAMDPAAPTICNYIRGTRILTDRLSG